MKKTRNSFFTEANMSYSGYTPNNVPNMAPNNVPYQAQSSYNSFYAAPMPNNMVPMMPQYNQADNIDSRLAKIERQISRLEHRISKLESVNTTFITEDIDTSGNMYML